MSEQTEGAVTFGPNAWLVDDMYEQYRQDPASVSESWREFFENYRPGGANLARPGTPEVKFADEDLVQPEEAAPTEPGAGTETPSAPTITPAARAAVADNRGALASAPGTAGAHYPPDDLAYDLLPRST